MPVQQLQIRTEMAHAKKAAVIHLVGQLDAHTFEMLQETLVEIFDKNIFRIVIEMSDISYISSAGAGVLIGGMSQCQGNGGVLILVNIRDSVMTVLRVLGLDNVFPIAPDTQTALAEL